MFDKVRRSPDRIIGNPVNICGDKRRLGVCEAHIRVPLVIGHAAQEASLGVKTTLPGLLHEYNVGSPLLAAHSRGGHGGEDHHHTVHVSTNQICL